MLFIFLPRPEIKTLPIAQVEEPTIKPKDVSLETKMTQYQKAQKILEKIDIDTQESQKRLADFYERFHISPTPYEIADGDLTQDGNTTSSSSGITSDSIAPTPDLHIGEIVENPIKTTYVIALLGDSMTDTLNYYQSYFKSLLSKQYPHYSFGVLNFGQGSTDLESGLKRLTEGTTYEGRYYPSVLSYKPDLLIIESFAYNPWSSKETDLNRQWITYAKMIDEIKSKSPDTKILFAASIGPNSSSFGDGKLNWTASQKKEKTDTIKKYLLNLIRFTQSQNLPVIDAYTSSLTSTGEGKPEFISSSDHIHPSQKGAQFFFDTVISEIEKNKIFP